ncbi:MAG TPA: autotransporter-associated beta strand repeat-containing protein [Pyrinomonadaceae bacterium]|nr:autotransporter-associated beta strand repeat-containing protein [Pyrinomonadaceae bacterium]
MPLIHLLTSSVCTRVAGAVVVCFLCTLPAFSATRTWTGGGGDNNWTTAANWGGTAPASGDSLVFPSGAARLSNTNNFAGGTSFNSITISGSGYTLGGNSIALGAGGLSDTNTSGSNTITLAISMSATRTYSISNAAETLTISGIISGSGGLTMSGNGTLVLSGADTFTGATTISNGSTLIAAANNALGTTGGATTVSSGGTLGFQGSINYSTTEAVTLNGAGVGGAGAILNVSGTNSFAGAVTMASASTFGSTSGKLTMSGAVANGGFLLTTAGAGSLEFSGVISGTGGLTKNGSGTLTLSGGSSNTFTGVTAVNDGLLELNKTATKNAYAGTLTVGDGTGASDSAIVRWRASDQAPSTTITVNSDGLVDLNNFSDAVGALTMTSGDITTGTGTLTLGGNITTNASSSSATISGNLALGLANRIIVVADGSATDDLVISAVVSGSFNMDKDGAGTLVLSGNNTYSKPTTIIAGMIIAESNNALGTTGGKTTISSGTTLAFDGGVNYSTAEPVDVSGAGVGGAGAILNLSGTNTFAGDLTIKAASTFGSNAGSLTISDTFSNSGFALTSTGAGDLIFSGVISSSGAFTKTGTGTTTLSAANTYTGLTTVTVGTLLVNGSLASGTTASLNGGTLGGTGTVRTVTATANGGVLSPGSPTGSPGILNAGNTTLNSASTYLVQLNGTTAGTGYDQLNVTGTVNLTDSTLSCTVGFAAAIGNTFTIINNDGSDAVTGTFSGLAEGARVTLSGQDFTISYVGGTGNDVVLTRAGTPDVSLTKDVSPSGPQIPDTDLDYTVTFTNSGSDAAQSLVITDPVPSDTDFKVGSVTSDLGTTGLTVAVAYSNDGGGTYAYTPASGGGGAPAGYDRNVTNIRWTFTGNLSQTSPNNNGSVGFAARIR